MIYRHPSVFDDCCGIAVTSVNSTSVHYRSVFPSNSHALHFKFGFCNSWVLTEVQHCDDSIMRIGINAHRSG